jgi:hypothetical protein
MIREVEGKGASLDDYAAVAHLSRNVMELRDHGSRLARQIAERTVWMADDLRSYDRTVWSAPEYVPAALRDRSTIIHPGLDPLSYKNRDLTFHKLVGHLLSDPEDPGEIADALTALLANTHTRRSYGQAAQRRVHEHFLVFTQVRRWVELLGAIAKESGRELASAEDRQQA